MKSKKLGALAAALAIAMTGCNSASIKEDPVTATLTPMDEPQYAVGYTAEGTRNDKPFSVRLVDIVDGKQMWETASGCRYSRTELFAPSLTWENCGRFADGSRTQTPKGSAWPLKVGNSWSYDYKGNDADGSTWSGTRHCEATTTARIETASGFHDTYKVECDEPSSARTFYVSPATGGVVRYERRFKRNGNVTTVEILKAS